MLSLSRIGPVYKQWMIIFVIIPGFELTTLKFHEQIFFKKLKNHEP